MSLLIGAIFVCENSSNKQAHIKIRRYFRFLFYRVKPKRTRREKKQQTAKAKERKNKQKWTHHQYIISSFTVCFDRYGVLVRQRRLWNIWRSLRRSQTPSTMSLCSRVACWTTVGSLVTWAWQHHVRKFLPTLVTVFGSLLGWGPCWWDRSTKEPMLTVWRAVCCMSKRCSLVHPNRKASPTSVRHRGRVTAVRPAHSQRNRRPILRSDVRPKSAHSNAVQWCRKLSGSSVTDCPNTTVTNSPPSMCAVICFRAFTASSSQVSRVFHQGNRSLHLRSDSCWYAMFMYIYLLLLLLWLCIFMKWLRNDDSV